MVRDAVDLRLGIGIAAHLSATAFTGRDCGAAKENPRNVTNVAQAISSKMINTKSSLDWPVV